MALFTFVQRSLTGGCRTEANAGCSVVTGRGLLGALLLAAVVSVAYTPVASASMWCVCWAWEEGDPVPDCRVLDDPPLCTDHCCPPEDESAGGDSEGSGDAGPENGSGDAGPGMFVNAATGNVWTEVPVVEARMADRSALNFRLRYDSRFAGGDPELRSLFRQTVLGAGWTHSYNRFAFKGANWGHAELMVIGAQGRRRSYSKLSGGVGTAMMPGVFSWITKPDSGTYRVHYQSGGYEEYDVVESPGHAAVTWTTLSTASPATEATPKKRETGISSPRLWIIVGA